MNPELTLLNEEEIWGNKQLEVIQKYGTKVAITDLAILTGGMVASDCHVEEDSTLIGRTGWIWTSSDDKSEIIEIVNHHGNRELNYKYSCYLCVRPALQSSAILNNISPNRVRGYNGVEEIEYGEYPQMAADANMQQILAREYEHGTLRKTGKDYTFDCGKFEDYGNGFCPVIYDEYEYQGKKYIRIKANTFYSVQIELSNGLMVLNGDYVWVEVQPVRWLLDSKTGKLVSKKGLVSGIQYQKRAKKYKSNFKKTEMYTYMNTHMVKDLFTSIPIKLKKEEPVEEDEISKLISKIKRLIEPMEDSKEQEIINRVNKLITDYQKAIQNLEPDISFDTSLSLEQNTSFTALKVNLICQLESIIWSFSENERLLNMLKQMNDYAELTKQQVEMPSRVENIADKIIYMLAVSRICNCPKIIDELNHIFDDIRSKISKILSKIYNDDYQLTLENEQDIQQVFSQVITNTYEAVNKYYTVQLLLRGIGETELAQDIQTLLFLIESSNLTNKGEMLLELDSLKQKFDLDACFKANLKDIMMTIRREMQPIIEQFALYNGAISEVQSEIEDLLSNEMMPSNIKEKSKLELAKLLEEWKIKLKNKENVGIQHPLYANLPKNTALQLLFLKDLYVVKHNIEVYLKEKEQFDRDIKHRGI